MTEPSRERIERAAEAVGSRGYGGKQLAERLARAVLTADDSAAWRRVAELEQENTRLHELIAIRREPCHYCGGVCDPLAGNPGLWPVTLCHKEEPGVPKQHHTACVQKRLRFLEEAVESLEAIKEVEPEQTHNEDWGMTCQEIATQAIEKYNDFLERRGR